MKKILVLLSFALLFAACSGKADSAEYAGTYRTQTYAGCYREPATGSELLRTLDPDTEIDVSEVDANGWAKLILADGTTAYANVYGLTPVDATRTFDAKKERAGTREALLPPWAKYSLFGLLWSIFVLSIVNAGINWRRDTGQTHYMPLIRIIAVMECAYIALYLCYAYALYFYWIFTPDYTGIGVVAATFIAGIAAMAAQYRSLPEFKQHAKDLFTGSRKPAARIADGFLMTVYTLSILYFVVLYGMIALMIAVAGLVIAGVLWLFDKGKLNTVTVRNENGKWTDGKDDYEVDDVRKTARKKKFFEL